MVDIFCCITIDTEPDSDTNWRRSTPLSYRSILTGIPEQLRPIWNKYEVFPTYFVSPEVVMSEICCEVLKDEVDCSAEIGSHLHGEYIEPEKKYPFIEGTLSDDYPCFAYLSDIEYEKIKNLTKLIMDNIGSRPKSYRAARYGADLETIRALVKLRYNVDSSITPHISWRGSGGPDHSRGLEQPYWISETNYYSPDSRGEKKLLEIPITIGEKRFGSLGRCLPESWLLYSWLRPTHMTVYEMKHLADQYIEKYQNKGSVFLNMMFHSMEIVPNASPYTRSSLGTMLILWRLENIIKYLKKIGCEFITLQEAHSRV